MSLKFPRPAHLRVQLANKLALQGGVSIVRALLADKNGPLYNDGLTIAEFYQLALQQPVPSDFYNPHVEEGVPYPPMPPTKLKGKQRQQPPGFTNPEHPVRSRAFFKRDILQFLVGTQEIMKIRSERVIDSATLFKVNKKGKKIPIYGKDSGQVNHSVWVWKAVDPATVTKPTPPSPPVEPFGAEVGLGEDLSHLSKKRQKARRADIRREVHMMKVQEGIRKQKERSAKGAELRRKQAERKARLEQERAKKGAYSEDAKNSRREREFNGTKPYRKYTKKQESEWEDKRPKWKGTKDSRQDQGWDDQRPKWKDMKKSRQEQEWEEKRFKRNDTRP